MNNKVKNMKALKYSLMLASQVKHLDRGHDSSRKHLEWI